MAQMNGMEKRNFTNSARNGGKTAEMRNNSAKKAEWLACLQRITQNCSRTMQHQCKTATYKQQVRCKFTAMHSTVHTSENIQYRHNTGMHRSTDIQQFWRQSLCSCGPRTMEQSSIAPERGGLTVQSIPVVTKDIFVWTVGSRHSVNYFNCAA